ncbi:MAG: restriction endonuclease [Smithellaceae bacterium]
MIIEQEPENWQDLQALTAKVFTEMGCMPEVEKKIKTVRGTVEIDVYVQDQTHTPPLILLCECKHWSKRIPKNVVHAFRTVAADFGANRGYIISKAGFQSGALEAAQNSNIVLLDWVEFQRTFYSRWVRSMTEKLYEYADIIFEYMDVLNDRMKDIEWTKDNESKHKNLILRSGIYVRANQWSDAGECNHTFPLTTFNPLSLSCENITLNNYREYFDLAFAAAPPLIAAWRDFFGERS